MLTEKNEPDNDASSDYDPEEALDLLTQDGSVLQQSLQSIVDLAVKEATSKIILAAGDKMRIQSDWRLPTTVQWSIHKSIRSHIHEGLRLMPTSSNAQLPYQHTLNDTLKSSIDSGDMHLIDYCNSYENCKNVPWDYIDRRILKDCNLPSCALHPLDVRKFNARINNDIVYNMRGDEARYINWFDLWNAVSPWDNQEKQHVRFSLPTAIMVLRLSGMKHITEVEDFLHFDHPNNNITCDMENRPNNSGHAFLIAKKLAEAWNAMVFPKHRQPPFGSDAYARMQKDCYTVHEVQQTIATLSRMIQKQPEAFKAQSELFFALRKTKSKVNHVDASRLFRPVATLETTADINTSLDLYRSYAAGEWTNTCIVMHDPVSCPRKVRNLPIPSISSQLAPITDFNWDMAKNTFPSNRSPWPTADFNSEVQDHTNTSDRARWSTPNRSARARHPLASGPRSADEMAFTKTTEPRIGHDTLIIDKH